MFGVVYTEGMGVKQDSLKAVEFYQKACDLGEDNGCGALGVMDQKGEGVKQDLSKAKKLYKKACDLKIKRGCEYYADIP